MYFVDGCSLIVVLCEGVSCKLWFTRMCVVFVSLKTAITLVISVCAEKNTVWFAYKRVEHVFNVNVAMFINLSFWSYVVLTFDFVLDVISTYTILELKADVDKNIRGLLMKEGLWSAGNAREIWQRCCILTFINL